MIKDETTKMTKPDKYEGKKNEKDQNKGIRVSSAGLEKDGMKPQKMTKPDKYEGKKNEKDQNKGIRVSSAGLEKDGMKPQKMTKPDKYEGKKNEKDQNKGIRVSSASLEKDGIEKKKSSSPPGKVPSKPRKKKYKHHASEKKISELSSDDESLSEPVRPGILGKTKKKPESQNVNDKLSANTPSKRVVFSDLDEVYGTTPESTDVESVSVNDMVFTRESPQVYMVRDGTPSQSIFYWNPPRSSVLTDGQSTLEYTPLQNPARKDPTEDLPQSSEAESIPQDFNKSQSTTSPKESKNNKETNKKLLVSAEKVKEKCSNGTRNNSKNDRMKDYKKRETTETEKISGNISVAQQSPFMFNKSQANGKNAKLKIEIVMISSNDALNLNSNNKNHSKNSNYTKINKDNDGDNNSRTSEESYSRNKNNSENKIEIQKIISNQNKSTQTKKTSVDRFDENRPEKTKIQSNREGERIKSFNDKDNQYGKKYLQNNNIESNKRLSSSGNKKKKRPDLFRENTVEEKESTSDIEISNSTAGEVRKVTVQRLPSRGQYDKGRSRTSIDELRGSKVGPHVKGVGREGYYSDDSESSHTSDINISAKNIGLSHKTSSKDKPTESRGKKKVTIKELDKIEVYGTKKSRTSIEELRGSSFSDLFRGSGPGDYSSDESRHSFDSNISTRSRGLDSKDSADKSGGRKTKSSDHRKIVDKNDSLQRHSLNYKDNVDKGAYL